jgi:hypothetical protein
MHPTVGSAQERRRDRPDDAASRAHGEVGTWSRLWREVDAEPAREVVELAARQRDTDA